MSEAPTASIVAKFDGNDAGLGLSIEPDSGVFADGFVHLLLHPYDTTIILSASVGEVAATDSKLVTVPGGMLTFRGSAEEPLPKRPHDTQPELQVVFAFDAEGEVITDEVEVSYNADANVVTLDAECDAAVKYTQYQTRSRKVIYAPQVTGSLSTYGVICAFHPASRGIILYEVQLPNLGEDGTDVELYRITSNYVLTANGPREKPPNYPTDGIYPGLPSSTTIDIEGTSLAEVVHEAGYMTPRGRGYVRENYQPLFEPYVGSTTYTKTKRYAASPLGDQYDASFKQRALSYIASLGKGKVPT